MATIPGRTPGSPAPGMLSTTTVAATRAAPLPPDPVAAAGHIVPGMLPGARRLAQIIVMCLASITGATTSRTGSRAYAIRAPIGRTPISALFRGPRTQAESGDRD